MKKILLLWMTLIPLVFLMSCTPKNDEPYSASNLFHNGLLSVCNLDNYCGYINQDGEVAIELKYSHTSDFVDGYAQVSFASKLGVIDTSGKEVIPLQYDYAGHRADLGYLMYSDYLSTLESVYEPYHYTDLSGRPIEDIKAYKLMGYNDATLVKKHDYSGSGQFPGYYFERISDGTIVIEEVGYALKDAYQESNIVCSSSHIFCRLIDENGDYITETYYSYPYLAYGDEMYTVMRGSKRGVINGSGDVIIPFEYDSIIFFNDEGVALLKIEGGTSGDLYGLVNLEGDMLVEPEYYLGNQQDNHFNGFEGTLYNLYDDEKEYLYNLKGELVFESFEDITAWTDSYFITYNKDNHLFSVFDTSGEPIFTDAAIIRKLDNHVFWMKQTQEDDFAFYDNQGQIVFESPDPDGDFPADFNNHSEETFYLINNDHLGLVNIYNSTGELIAGVPQEVSIEIFADGYILLSDSSNQFLFSIIDFSGALIIDYQYKLARL